MAHTFTVQISDADWRALCYVSENPSQYCDDTVTEYIRQMKETVVQELIKKELCKDCIRDIPADAEVLLARAVLKPAKELMAESEEKMAKMVANPDDVQDFGGTIDLPDD